MSDGGAQVIVMAGEGVLKLAGFRVGRVVLWFIAAYLTLTAITASGSRALYFFLALGIALVALVAGFLSERRKRAERAAIRQALMVVGVVLVSVIGAVFLAFRKKKQPPMEAPPTQAELDEALRE